MSDDWRLRLTLGSHHQASQLADQLEEGKLEHALESGAGDRVVVSVDDNEVFLYTDTREQAERASASLAELARTNAWQAQAELRHWHPEAEEWEDPDAPLPEAAPDIAAEREERVAREREESREMGYAEYEVRVECHSHRDTVALAERLRDEGLQPLRRWRFLLIGANDEESAQALADRLSQEVPAGCTVRVEATLATIEAETGGNPFAVFGGLGG